MESELYCIKIGGSVITDKSVPYKARKSAIRAIAKSLKQIKKPLLIAHGVGSFAHTSAQKYGGKNGYRSKWGIAKVARDAQEINRIVMDILIEEGLPAISFSPRGFLLTENADVQDAFLKPIYEALNQHLIPVVHGDVVWDSAQKTTILSGESVLNLLCRSLQKNGYSIASVIQLCNVAGVLDAENNVISEIRPNNWGKMKRLIQKSNVADVTGGMMHKIEDALAVSRFNIQTVVINGNSDELLKVINGREFEGTVIH